MTVSYAQIRLSINLFPINNLLDRSRGGSQEKDPIQCTVHPVMNNANKQVNFVQSFRAHTMEIG
jgi:hypothetical protein